MTVTFRRATIADTALILSFIIELAEYEKMAKEVVATEDDLKKTLFCKNPYAEVVFAVVEGDEVGFVLFFHNYSTFLGKQGIYIEDLYVKPGIRGKGVGRSLLSYISRLAIERGCGRVEWWVLNWNPARKFYESIGASAMNDWTVYRLEGDKLKELSVARSAG